MKTGVPVLAAVVLVACGGQSIRVGAGTTVADGGFVDAVLAAYENETSVVAGSTAELLQLGDSGSLGLAITHDPFQEREYLAAHPSAIRSSVFQSRFRLVGPPGEAIALRGLSPIEAFQAIEQSGYLFVSRADGSGTFAKENQLWSEAGTRPARLVETGQGMGFTLQVASERGGFVLVDEGAFLVAEEVLDLVPVELADSGTLLTNEYSVMLFDAAARHIYDWLIGKEGAAAVGAANGQLFGTTVYRSDRQNQQSTG